MTNKIKEAFELVYKLQPEVMRIFSPLPEGKEIYWTHLYTVYKTCVYWGNSDEKLLLAAILHDVLEDTEYTTDELRNKFGQEVLEIITLCSKKKSYELFKKKDQDEYFSKIFKHKDKKIQLKVMKIKLADRLDNLIGSTFIENKETKMKYLAETKKYYRRIARKLNKSEILNSAIKNAEKTLKNDK